MAEKGLTEDEELELLLLLEAEAKSTPTSLPQQPEVALAAPPVAIAPRRDEKDTSNPFRGGAPAIAADISGVVPWFKGAKELEGNEITETLSDAGTGLARWGTFGFDDVVAGLGAAAGTIGQEVYSDELDEKGQPIILTGLDAARNAYRQGANERRDVVDAAAERSPTAYKVGALAGGLLSLPVGGALGAAGKTVGKAIAPTRALAPLLAGGALPGAVGAVGLGDPESKGDAVTDAVTGAALGAGLGWLLPKAGAAVGKAAASAQKTLAPKVPQRLKDLLPVASESSMLQNARIAAVTPGASAASRDQVTKTAGNLLRPPASAADDALAAAEVSRQAGTTPATIAVRQALANKAQDDIIKALSDPSWAGMAGQRASDAIGRLGSRVKDVPTNLKRTEVVLRNFGQEATVIPELTASVKPAVDAAVRVLQKSGSGATNQGSQRAISWLKTFGEDIAKMEKPTAKVLLDRIRDLDDQIINATSREEGLQLAIIRDQLENVLNRNAGRAGGDFVALMREALENERAAKLVTYASGITREAPSGLIAGLPGGQSLNTLLEKVGGLWSRGLSAAPGVAAPAAAAQVGGAAAGGTPSPIDALLERGNVRVPDVRIPDLRDPRGASDLGVRQPSTRNPVNPSGLSAMEALLPGRGDAEKIAQGIPVKGFSPLDDLVEERMRQTKAPDSALLEAPLRGVFAPPAALSPQEEAVAQAVAVYQNDPTEGELYLELLDEASRAEAELALMELGLLKG